MECINFKRNKQICTCTYTLKGTSTQKGTSGPCPKKGLCCDCIAYHREAGEIPGCLFPVAAEKTYDRSIRKFVQVHQ